MKSLVILSVAKNLKNSPSLAEGARGWVDSLSLRDLPKASRGNPKKLRK